MIGLSVANRESKSAYVKPWGCSVLGCSLNRSTTLMNRIFKSGNRSLSSALAANASWVGISPAAAKTTSGSWPSSLLAQFQIPKLMREYGRSLRLDDEAEKKCWRAPLPAISETQPSTFSGHRHLDARHRYEERERTLP